MRKTLGVAAVILTALALLMGCGGGASTPEEAVRAFINACKNKDIKAIVGCFSNASVKVFADSLRRLTQAPGVTEESFDKEMKANGLKLTYKQIKELPDRDLVVAFYGDVFGMAKKMSAGLPDFSGMSDAMVISCKVDDGKAIVKIQSTGGQQEDVFCVREEGAWKIHFGP